jgi:hypothetical protein
MLALGVVATLLVVRLLTDTYEARAKLVLQPSSILQVQRGAASFQPDRAVPVLKGREVLEGVAVKIGRRPTAGSVDDLRGRLVVVQRTDRRSVDLIAKAGSRAQALELVDAWAITFVSRRRQILSAGLERARRRSAKRLARLLSRAPGGGLNARDIRAEGRRATALRNALAVDPAAVTAADAETVRAGEVVRQGPPAWAIALLSLGAGGAAGAYVHRRQRAR